MAFFLAGAEGLGLGAWRRKSRGLMRLLLRASVSRGSDSPPDCHSLPLPFKSFIKSPTKQKGRLKRPFRFGRGRRTWTHDPWFWRPVLYQLSYTPMHVDYYTVKSRICQEILQKYFSNLTRMGIKTKKTWKKRRYFWFFSRKTIDFNKTRWYNDYNRKCILALWICSM